MPRLTITVPGNAPQKYGIPLDEKLVTLGRDGGNDIVMDSVSVSKQHARLVRVPRGFELQDAGSTNGMKSGGQFMERIRLGNGSMGTIGDVDFFFSLSEEEIQTLEAERMALPALPSAPPTAEPVKPLASTENPEASVFGDNDLFATSYEQPRSKFFSRALFALFALAILFAGLTFRHHRDTGRWLFSDMLQHFSEK